MSLFGWPSGRRRSPGQFRHHVNPARTREEDRLPVARAADHDDLWGIYGSPGRRSCVDGHDLVVWRGDDVCWVCGGPGLGRDEDG